MQEYILPDHLLSDAAQTSAQRLSVISYRSNATSSNNKITFRQNVFNFLLEGEKAVHYAGKQEKIKPDRFMLLSAGNCLMSERTAPEAGLYRSILFFFDNEVLADFFIRYPQTIEISGAITDIPFLVFEKDSFLESFAASLESLLAAKQPISEDMKAIKLEELLLYLTERYPGQIRQLRGLSQRADDDLLIRQSVTSNIDQAITVDELAFLCHMSLSTFKRRFSQIYGTSPRRWLLEQRMQKAAQLLRQGTHKPSELYLDLGYENLSSFIQSFKQVHGVTPKQYQLAH